MMRKAKIKLAIWLVLSLALGTVVTFVCVPLFKVARHIGLFEHHDMRQYEGSNVQNLHELYRAMMNYHESEGQFPKSGEWMDSVKPRMQANDMKQEEALKKLVNPMLPSKPNSFGYAMNDAASGKYRKDIDPKMPLIYDSANTKWNAHGDPKSEGKTAGGKAITVDGSIVEIATSVH